MPIFARSLTRNAILSVLLLATLLAVPSRATVPAPSSILPQFAFGGGWYSALYFTNTTGAPVSFTVSFVSDGGTPLTVPALGGAATQVNLAANGSAIVEAPNVGALVQGYAAFTLPDGVTGYGVFRQSVPGQLDQEAVVPLTSANATSTILTWDETNLITAVAIVNPSSIATTVNITLWDESGNTIGTAAVPLAAGGKTATTLHSLQGLAGMVGKRGSAQFSVSAGGVAVLGLRFNHLAFTSIPTTGATPGASSIPSVLPQFAFGGGWYSALYFTNVSNSPVSFTVSFVSDSGSALVVPSAGGATTQVNIGAEPPSLKRPTPALWYRATPFSRFRPVSSAMASSGKASPDSPTRKRWCLFPTPQPPRTSSPGTTPV